MLMCYRRNFPTKKMDRMRTYRPRWPRFECSKRLEQETVVRSGLVRKRGARAVLSVVRTEKGPLKQQSEHRSVTLELYL